MHIVSKIIYFLASCSIIRAAPINNGNDERHAKRDLSFTDPEILAPTVVIGSLAALLASYGAYTVVMTRALDQELATRAGHLESMMALSDNLMKLDRTSTSMTDEVLSNTVQDTYKTLLKTFTREISLAKRKLTSKAAKDLSDIEKRAIEQYQKTQTVALAALKEQGPNMTPSEIYHFVEANPQLQAFQHVDIAREDPSVAKALKTWYTEQQTLLQSQIDIQLKDTTGKLGQSLDRVVQDGPDAAEQGITIFANEEKALLYEDGIQDAFGLLKKSLQLQKLWVMNEKAKVRADLSTLEGADATAVSSYEFQLEKAMNRMAKVDQATLEDLKEVAEIIDFKNADPLSRQVKNRLNTIHLVLDARLKTISASQSAKSEQDAAAKLNYDALRKDSEKELQEESSSWAEFSEENPRVVEALQQNLDEYIATKSGITKDALAREAELDYHSAFDIRKKLQAEGITLEVEELIKRWKQLLHKQIGFYKPFAPSLGNLDGESAPLLGDGEVSVLDLAQDHLEQLKNELSSEELAAKLENPLEEDISQLLQKLKDEGFEEATEQSARELWSRLAAGAKL